MKELKIVVAKINNEEQESRAVELYRAKKVSLGFGASLAGVSLSEFIDLLRENGVYLNLEKEDVEKAIETARKVL